jgi:hypothetical protein
LKASRTEHIFGIGDILISAATTKEQQGRYVIVENGLFQRCAASDGFEGKLKSVHLNTAQSPDLQFNILYARDIILCRRAGDDLDDIGSNTGFVDGRSFLLTQS